MSGDVYAVAIEESDSFQDGPPEFLFRWEFPSAYRVNFDVASDGRFLMIESKGETGAGATLTVVENWFEKLNLVAPPESE